MPSACARVEHARHVLALQARGGAGLAGEAGHHVGVPGELGEQHLDGHPLPRLAIRRGHDGAHAAHAEDALDVVPLRDPIAGPQG